jgi:5-formyltetrahydrofolate cyclo-ligase
MNGRHMEWRVISGPDDWKPGAWGMPEPDLSRTTPLPDDVCPDAVLVPGLAFHPDGSRLGYGGGFYDRMYAAESARGRGSICWIGFAFSLQISDEPLPREPHDLALDVLATEEKLIWLK